MILALFERIPEGGTLHNGISYTAIEMKGAIPYPERGRVGVLCFYLMLGKLMVWTCFNQRKWGGVSLDYRFGMDVYWGKRLVCSF